jgi:hypothetical protein
VQLAVLLLSKTVQQSFTIFVLFMSAALLGILGDSFLPGMLGRAIDYMQLPPTARTLLISKFGEGNPHCWYGGYAYDFCCIGSWGNLRCWEQQQVLLRTLATGGMGLSCVGFAIYVYRQVLERWEEANGSWQIALFGMWLMHFGSVSLGRIVAVVGSALAFRELYSVVTIQAKQTARKIGDRVLEVN